MSKKSWAVLALGFFLLIVFDCVAWQMNTHQVPFYELKSPVPIIVSSVSSLGAVHGWGGVSGSSVLMVDNKTFWSYAERFGKVWVVHDSFGWHVITFGNESLVYGLVSFSNVTKVVWSRYEVVFYGYKVDYESVWQGLLFFGVWGFLISMIGVIWDK